MKQIIFIIYYCTLLVNVIAQTRLSGICNAARNTVEIIFQQKII